MSKYIALFNRDPVSITKDYNVFNKYINHSDGFDDVKLNLPMYFYIKEFARSVCPIKVEANKYEAIFSTGSKMASKAFLKEYNIETFKDLKDGVYLYDFENDKVIYDYTTRTYIGYHNEWSSIPPTQKDANLQHVIGVDNSGKIHRMYHDSSSFADACFLGDMINISFPNGEYTIKYEGVSSMFAFLARRFDMTMPTPKRIKAFMEHSFKPRGLGYPDYDISTDFLDDVFNPVKEEKEAKNISLLPFDYSENLPLFGNPYKELFDPNFVNWMEDDFEINQITLYELMGNANPPKPEEDVTVLLNVVVPGLSKVVLTKNETIYVYYDGKITDAMELAEHLELPYAITFYFDVNDPKAKEVN